MDRTRCRHCGDVIGAYEPMVMLSNGFAYKTSRARAGELVTEADECYHDLCYAQIQDEGSLEH